MSDEPEKPNDDTIPAGKRVMPYQGQEKPGSHYHAFTAGMVTYPHGLKRAHEMRLSSPLPAHYRRMDSVFAEGNDAEVNVNLIVMRQWLSQFFEEKFGKSKPIPKDDAHTVCAVYLRTFNDTLRNVIASGSHKSSFPVQFTMPLRYADSLRNGAKAPEEMLADLSKIRGYFSDLAAYPNPVNLPAEACRGIDEFRQIIHLTLLKQIENAENLERKLLDHMEERLPPGESEESRRINPTIRHWIEAVGNRPSSGRKQGGAR